jgi:hypothetical protein
MRKLFFGTPENDLHHYYQGYLSDKAEGVLVAKKIYSGRHDKRFQGAID